MSSTAEKSHVARLYFLRGLTKQEIGKLLGVSRFRVARLLEEARADGTVRIEIADEAPQADETARELEQAYSVELAVVVPGEGDIPRAAAAWLPQLISGDDVVGVAWGATLAAIVKALPRLDLGVPVVQVCGAFPDLETGSRPSEVAFELAERLGGPLFPLPAPAFASPEARADLLRNEAVRPTVELFERVTVALVGIGARPPAGHILVHHFDVQGNVLAADSLALALSLEGLRRVPRVVAAAGGKRKRRAVLGALRSGLVDVLVTDEANARYALGRA